jgi:hypothetical protein
MLVLAAESIKLPQGRDLRPWVLETHKILIHGQLLVMEVRRCLACEKEFRVTSHTKTVFCRKLCEWAHDPKRSGVRFTTT